MLNCAAIQLMTRMPTDDRKHARGMRVARPRVVGARRSVAGRFTIGDECIAEFFPGLLQLLSLGDPSNEMLGAGAALPWSVPVAAAGTAAYGVLEPPGFARVNSWTGITNLIQWTRAVSADETLLAHCRLAHLGRTSARLPYRVVGGERRDLVVTGEFVFVSITREGPRPYHTEPHVLSTPLALADLTPGEAAVVMIERSMNPGAPIEAAASVGGVLANDDASPEVPNLDDLWTRDAPRHIDPPEPLAADLFALRPPHVEMRSGDGAGEVWRWLFPNDLFRLLAHPIAGHSEPLGRRFHPYGRILEGMGVHATLAMAGRGEPREASVRWRAPVRGNANFHLTSTIERCTADELTVFHLIREGEREVGDVRVRVVR
jgi:hypothetical protein